jgi:hypothetical protein
MTIRAQIMVLTLVVFCFQGSPCLALAPIVKPSELNMDQQRNDEKQVRVRGWVYFGHPIGQIWDSEGSYKKGMLTQCVSLVVTNKNWIRQFNRTIATVIGTFNRDILAGKVDFAVCNNAGIEAKEIFR